MALGPEGCESDEPLHAHGGFTVLPFHTHVHIHGLRPVLFPSFSLSFSHLPSNRSNVEASGGPNGDCGAGRVRLS